MELDNFESVAGLRAISQAAEITPSPDCAIQEPLQLWRSLDIPASSKRLDQENRVKLSVPDVDVIALISKCCERKALANLLRKLGHAAEGIATEEKNPVEKKVDKGEIDVRIKAS